MATRDGTPQNGTAGEIAAGILLLGGLGVALFSHFAGLLPEFMGLWPDSESIFLAVQGGCALLALGLALTGRGAAGDVLADLTHPLVLLPLALAGWSVVGALGAADPALALLGLPQTGDGALLFLDIALLTAGTLHLRRKPGLARGLGVLVAASAAIIPALSWWESTQVYFFGAWVSYLALAAPPAVMVLLEGWLSRSQGLLLGVALGVLGLAATGSKTAAIAGALGLLALVFLWWPRLDRARWATPWALAVAVAAWAVLLVVITQVAGEYRELESVWSRAHLQRALLADFMDQPRAWIVGEGWGQIRDSFTRGLPAAGLPLWDVDHWDMLRRDVVNSHNALIDALLAGGLPGLALRVALIMALPLFAAPGRRGGAAFLGLTLATLGGMWFQVPGTVAVVAVAHGALAELRPAWSLDGTTKNAAFGGVRLLLAVLAVGFVFVAGTLIRDAIPAYRLDRDVFSGKPLPEAPGCLPPGAAGWRGAAYLGEILSRTLKTIRSGPEPGKVAPAPETVHQLLCTADRPEFRSLAGLGMFALVLRGDLILSAAESPYRSLGVTLVGDWEARLRAHLARAPRRIDAAIDYFVWLYKQERYLQMLALAGRMLAETPGTPLAHWYSGAALIRLGSPEQAALARQHFRQALAHNVDLFLPVRAEDRAWILQGD